MTDGLAEMFSANDQARRAARKVPPPRRPKKVIAAADVEDNVQAPRADATPTPPPVTTSEEKRAAPAPSTIARSVQLDDAAEEFLDTVRSAGRRARVDANRSAVIRLALRRLHDELTPEEIAAALQRAPIRTGAGRRVL